MATATSAKLASGGNDIKIWDSLPYVLSNQFNPYSSSIRCLNWSPDLLYLVTVPTNGESVVATHIKNTDLNNIEINAGTKHTYARFANTTSRILAVGATNGTIHVWNMKIQKTKTVFTKQKSEVTCLQFNWNDAYISSGSLNGDIILHSTLTNQEHILYSSSRPESIKDLQYSYVKKSLLGTASESGSLSLWDVNEMKLVHNFKQSHTSPCMGISFSPVNNLLLASVGLDKRLICYDPQLKSCIKTYRTETPLTTVDFMDDGITLAVGSIKGKIYIYDLRSSSIPVKTLAAHNSSIRCLSFQHLSHSFTNKSGMTSKKIVNSNKDNEPVQLGDSNVILQKMNFGNKDINSNISPKIVQENMQDNSHETSNSTLHTGSDSFLKLESVFSPLGSHEDNESIGNVRRQPIGGGCLPNLTSTTGIQNAEMTFKHLPIEVTQASSIKSIYSNEAEDEQSDGTSDMQLFGLNTDNSEQVMLSLAASERSTNLCLSDNILKHAVNEAWSNENVTHLLKTVSNQEGNDDAKLPIYLKKFPQDCNLQTDNEVNTVNIDNECKMETESLEVKETQHLITGALKEHIKKTIQSTFKEEIQQIIQVSFRDQMQQEIHELVKKCVQQVVENSVVDLHDALHREHNQLQFEMIRQFQIQLIEIQELLKQTLLNEQHLMSEVERLKTENDKLKIIY